MKLLSSILQKELENAAFHLLACSTSSRFVRVAKRLARSSKLTKRIREQPELIPELVNDAGRIWRELVESTTRDVQEAQLALVLPVLAETASRNVSELLTRIALSTQPSTLWIAVLARRLREEQVVNEELSLVESTSPSVVHLEVVKWVDFVEDSFVNLESTSEINYPFLYQSPVKTQPPLDWMTV